MQLEKIQLLGTLYLAFISLLTTDIKDFLSFKVNVDVGADIDLHIELSYTVVINEYTGEAIKVYGLPNGMELKFEEPNAPLTPREKLRRKLRRVQKKKKRNSRSPRISRREFKKRLYVD